MARRIKHAILGAALALLLLQVAAAALLLERGRQKALARASQDVERVARSAEAHLNRHFTQIESLLAGLPTILAPGNGRFDAARAGEVLQELNNQNLVFRDLMLLDAQGQAVATALSVYRRRRLPLPQGPGFLEYGLQEGGLRIGGPIRNPASREWALLFAQPGAIAGLPQATAMAEVPLSALAGLLATGNEIPGLRVLLLRQDGMVLAAAPHDETLIGTQAAAPDAGDIAVTRPTPYGQLAIRASLPRAAALADWSGERWPTLLFSTLFAAMIVALAGLLLLVLRQREEAAGDRWRSTLASALDSMTDGFVVFGPDDRLVICNERFREMYALTAPFLKEGASYRDIMREGALRGQFPQIEGSVDEFIDEMSRWRRSKSPPIERLLPDGRWLLVTERMTPDGGTIGIRTDITALKHANEELAQARDAAQAEDEAKGLFLARMSHELRTPLNSMLGFAQALMTNNELGPAEREQLRLLHDAGGHLRELVNRLLDLTKIEAGQLDLDTRPVTLRPLLEACAGLMAPDVERKRLSLHLDIAAGVPAVVEADAMRLRQMLLNLLSNAVKFTPAGGQVALRLLRATRLHGIRIEVADSGPGVPAEKKHLLFRDFSQLAPHAGPEGLGTGLGLAITARLVSAMGGHIGCDSEPGAGAIFWLELPLQEILAPGEDRPQTPRPLARRSLDVLVVDDLAPNRLVMQALLAAEGHRLTFAASGVEAVAALEREAFDLVLMDVHMGEMTGLEATRRIRRLPAPRNATPILGVTASTLPEEVAACYEAGMDGYLSKPVDRDSLLSTMHDLVAGASWKRPARAQPASEAPPVLNEATLRRLLQEMGPLAGHAVRDMIEEIRQGCDILSEPGIARDPTRMRHAAHMTMEPARSLGAERLSAVIDALQRAIRSGQDVTPNLRAIPAAAAETLPMLESLAISA
ncbi:ATP-binding protein [Roseococcus sp. YIM B11640]|uniref:ATP-binding protein n=1 Tax=Roseococcus sp. YIM B11640 TaxID=3133973 RepID=UPI003C7DF6EE